MAKPPSEQKITHSLSVDRDLFGLPGQPFRFAIRRVSGQPKPEGEGSSAGLREFDVIFTLSRPGEPLLSDRHVTNAERLKGNSYLRFRDSSLPATPGANQIKFQVLTDDGYFEVREFANDEGFLGKVEIVSIKARDFMHAEDIARRLIIPSLSWHSTHFDTPLHIYQVDVVDMQTGDFQIYRAAKFYDAIIVSRGVRVLALQEESSAYASLYREALNSNSHVYQFLCFYKIIEGVRRRRERLAQEAKARGERPTQMSERIPSDIDGVIALLTKIFSVDRPWDTSAAKTAFPTEYWGKKVNDVADKELRPLRNVLGHAFLDDSEIPMSVDEFANAAKVSRLLPMTKCIARWMLKNEFPAQFPSDLSNS
jgi:hypothetical protein